MPTPDLLDAFFNPPAGGNARGVPTVNIMVPQGMDRYASDGGTADGYPMNQGGSSGPGSQTNNRVSFEAGIASARDNRTQSGAAGQPEMRNYKRTAYYRAQDQTQLGQEIGEEGTERGGVTTTPPAVRLVTPQYEPPKYSQRRSDGRSGTGR